MLKPCSFHALRINFVQPMLFSQLSCSFVDAVYSFTKMVHDECLDDPQRGSQQCQRVPSVRVESDQLVTRRATQPSDAIADPQTKEAGTSLLATKVVNKRVSLNSKALCPQQSIRIQTEQLPRRAVFRSGLVQSRGSVCNDKTAHSSMVHSTGAS